MEGMDAGVGVWLQGIIVVWDITVISPNRSFIKFHVNFFSFDFILPFYIFAILHLCHFTTPNKNVTNYHDAQNLLLNMLNLPPDKLFLLKEEIVTRGLISFEMSDYILIKLQRN